MQKEYTEIMRIICAWCGKDMGEKEGKGVEGTSHSICDECADKVVAEMASLLEEEEDIDITESDGDA